MSEDALMGALYVLEGSRLGAKFLVKQARASRDPVVRDAIAYLSHGDGQSFLGRATSQHWRIARQTGSTVRR